MDCRTAQEQMIESFENAQPAANTPDLDTHLAGCEDCRSFLETQSLLDLQLSATISPPQLSAAFRKTLAKRIRREAVPVWPEFLPDLAHVVGSLGGTALCVAMLPFSPGPVVLGGLAFTVATYFLQAIMQGSVEAREEE